MPNLTTITVNDSELNAQAFTPHSEDKGLATFSVNGATLVSNKLLTISSNETASNVKVRIKIEDPIVQSETVNGVSREVVVRKNYADATFTFAKSSTLVERQNIVRMFANTLDANQTEVDAVLTGMEKWY